MPREARLGDRRRRGAGHLPVGCNGRFSQAWSIVSQVTSQVTEPSDYRAAVREVMSRGVEWEIEPSLDRIRDVVDVMGEPQRAYPVIHITGTNGKSSTARMIEALLRER